MKSRIAIVAALEREVRPLTRNWKREAAVDGATVYASENAIVAYAGIGAQRAEVATGVALSYGPVHQLISVGWAGGLHEGIESGAVRKVGSVIDVSTGHLFETSESNGDGRHSTVLVTLDHIASAREKKRLHDRLSADLVDMEAAAVARIAERRGIPFLAVKAVSDDHEFDFPGMEKFTTAEGRFREGAFAAYVALRPALWKSVARMANHSAIAAKNLCNELERYLAWEEEHVKA